MANILKIQTALFPHLPKIIQLSRILLNIYKNIPYPFKFLAEIPVSLKPFHGLVDVKYGINDARPVHFKCAYFRTVLMDIQMTSNVTIIHGSKTCLIADTLTKTH